VIWQDSLLSITYDRASSATKLDSQLPPWPESEKMPYAMCMRSLCKIGLDIVNQRSTSRGSQHELLRIVQYREKIKEILEHASDHLRDTNMCRSIRDQLEHWNLYLHRSYITSELCRPAINHRLRSSELLYPLRKTCIDSLADTVEAFIGLQNITPFASQSWAAVHRSLSSALLLAILREPSRNDRARNLLSKLVAVMSSINTGVNPLEYSAPITRSLEALKKLLPTDIAQSPAQGLERKLSYEQGDFDWPGTSSSPSLSYSSSETSPYSIMDNILWGDRRLHSFSEPN
jgi:hypothetical protein